MPFDAVFLKSMTAEINDICLGGKVDKINMPERDRIVITVRTLGKNKIVKKQKVIIVRKCKSSQSADDGNCV